MKKIHNTILKTNSFFSKWSRNHPISWKTSVSIPWINLVVVTSWSVFKVVFSFIEKRENYTRNLVFPFLVFPRKQQPRMKLQCCCVRLSTESQSWQTEFYYEFNFMFVKSESFLSLKHLAALQKPFVCYFLENKLYAVPKNQKTRNGKW